MYPDLPTTVEYCSHRRTSDEGKITEAFGVLCHCMKKSEAVYPACVNFLGYSPNRDLNIPWEFYLEVCDVMWNMIEDYLKVHYPELAMEALMLS